MKTSTQTRTTRVQITKHTNTDDLIKKYLLQGGNVTQCKAFNPGGLSGAIRTKGARKRDLGSKKGRENSSLRFK